MPEHRGRPKIHKGKTTDVTIRFDDEMYDDYSRWASEHGLSVPMYCAMMLNLHRNGVRDDERKREYAKIMEAINA